MGEVPPKRRTRFTSRYSESIEVGVDPPVVSRSLEIDLNEQWTAAFRFLEVDGQLQVSEVRVFPKEPYTTKEGEGRSLGEWSINPQSVPEGGLPSELMKLIPFRAAKEQAQYKAREAQAIFSIPGLAVAETPHRSGRKGKPNIDAQVAAAYAAEFASGNTRPHAALAEQLDMPLTEVKRRIKQAREKGFLTSPGQGRAGGELTEAGKATLGEQSSKTPQQPLSLEESPMLQAGVRGVERTREKLKDRTRNG